jgi:hypothetical protein
MPKVLKGINPFYNNSHPKAPRRKDVKALVTKLCELCGFA